MTRLKENTVYEVVERRVVPQRSNVVADEVIFFPSQTEANKEYFCRRVEIDDPEQGRLVFLTNYHKLGATTVAAVYKDRWQVELFFKELKQNLRIKPGFPFWPWYRDSIHPRRPEYHVFSR